MSNRLLLKSSGTADAVPDFDDLELAELVVNTHNGKMFCKTYDGQTYAIVDLTLSSPDEIIASGPGLIGRSASGGGACALLSGADAVGLLPAASASADGKATAAQITLLDALNSRETIGVVTDDWSPVADTTFEDIPGLSIASVPANTSYIFKAWMLVNVIAAADFKINLYTGATCQKLSVHVRFYSSDANIRYVKILDTVDTTMVYDWASNQIAVVEMNGFIKTHASISDVVKLQMAERVNATAPTVYAGAYMSLKRVSV